MGNSASSLPFSIDNQVGAPHDHNGWALHDGKSTDGHHTEVSVFVGKKPSLSKTPISPRHPGKMQLVPALHHYNHCRRLRHPHILKVLATLDTDNPSAATTESGGIGSPAKASSAAAGGATSSMSATANATATGDLIVVTEPCVSLTQWLLSGPTPDQLAWGIECIVQGLHFMHNSAGLAHGNLSPASLYVTRSGDVKLWNFSIVTPIGPPGTTAGPGTNTGGGPTPHFQQWEDATTPDAYRGPERIERRWDAIAQTGVHAMDSYGMGVLVDHIYQGRIPPPLQKAVQRMLTPNLKMRPRLQPLLKCPVFDTPYQKMQLQLEEITVQPVEQKVALWQNLGNQMQHGAGGIGGGIPKDVALYKILPLVMSSIQIICNNESMLAQDMYRREVLAMLVPLFFIEEQYQDPSKIGKELAPLISKLFTVPDRGVRSILLNQVGFMTKHLDKNALNANVFEPLCSGFNDSSAALRELTLKATLGLVPSLNSPSLEKLSRYLVRLQADTETSIRTNAVIFIAKIAPHLSEVSKQKMLLPAYVRAMRDTFAPCRLSALQSTLVSKKLFTMQDLATKVLPSVMPLLLDPTNEVRDQAFKVVQDLLEDLRQESKRMEQMVPPPGGSSVTPGQPVPQQQQQQQHQGTAANGSGGLPVAPASGGSGGGYLSGLSSWMSASTQPTTTGGGATAATTVTPGKPAMTHGTTPPSIVTRQATPQQQAYMQPPIQKFSAATLNPMSPSVPAATSAVNDGWGDEGHDDDVDVDDDDNWGDDDEDETDSNRHAFSNIGSKTTTSVPTSFTTPTTAARSGFGGMDDDPFAAIGMKTAGIMPRPATRGTSGGLLVVPKKTNWAIKGKVTAPPATKLKVEEDDVADGWDDF